MNGKTPSFVVDYMRSKGPKDQVRDQITIIKKGPGMSMGTPISMSRNTGAGVDNAVQPGKYAGDVHEGERVLSANASQAIPNDVFSALSSQAERGELDVNALRQVLRLPEQPGYAMGTGQYPARPPRPIVKPVPQQSDPQKQQQGSGADPTQSISLDPTQNLNSSNVAPQKVKPITPVDPNQQKQQQGSGADPTQTLNLSNGAPPQVTAPKPAFQPIQIAPAAQPAAQPSPLQITKPQPYSPGAPMGAVAPIVPPSTQPTTQTGQPSKYSQIIDTSLQQLMDISQGKSEAERRLADMMLRRYDTNAASGMDANSMALAGDRTLSPEARRSLMAQAQSGIRGGRSELIGTMAGDAAQRAQAATGQMAGIAAGQQSFEEGVREFDVTTEEGKQRWNQEFAEGKRRWDADTEFRRQEADRKNKLDNLGILLKSGIAGNQDAIVKGFGELGITLNPQYLVDQEKGTQFQNAMATFSTLVATPGMTAQGAIGAMKQSGLYDALAGATNGPEPVWSGTPETDPRVLAKAGTLTDMKGAEWLTENGYDLLGNRVDGGGIVSLFNSMKNASNPIDAAWGEYSNSTWYKGLPLEDQKSVKALFDYTQAGKALPYTVTTDKDGKVKIVPKTAGELEGDETKVPEGLDPGGLFVSDKTNGLYKNEGKDKSPTKIDPSTLTKKDLKGKNEDDPVVKAVMGSIDLTSDPKSLWGTNGEAFKGTGKLLKIIDPSTGKEVLVTYDSNYNKEVKPKSTAKKAMALVGGVWAPKTENQGIMVFTTTDGRKIEIAA